MNALLGRIGIQVDNLQFYIKLVFNEVKKLWKENKKIENYIKLLCDENRELKEKYDKIIDKVEILENQIDLLNNKNDEFIKIQNNTNNVIENQINYEFDELDFKIDNIDELVTPLKKRQRTK